MISSASVSPSPAQRCRRPVLSTLFAATLMFIGIGAVQALPVELTAAEFAAQTAGLSIKTEAFEGFAVGNQANPLTFSNGSFTAAIPNVANFAVYCGDNDKCLLDAGISGARTFSTFPSGTKFWGTDFFAINTANVFQVTVNGLGGISVFTRTPVGGFWGFNDPLGLTSVSFTNLGAPGVGMGNYSFDNVRTAAPNITVPEPTALALLGLGLASFRLVRNRGDLRAAAYSRY